MNFAIMLLVFLMALVFTRVLFTLHCNSQKETEKAFDRVLLSLAVLGMFLGIGGVVNIYMVGKQVLDSLVWYGIFTFFGVSTIVWCYFRWDLKWKAKPKLEEDKIVLALKKASVFACIMIFSFYHGYKQMDAIISDTKVDSTLTVYNVTMISGIIALDRVLNQAISAYKGWKENQKEQTIKDKN